MATFHTCNLAMPSSDRAQERGAWVRGGVGRGSGALLSADDYSFAGTAHEIQCPALPTHGEAAAATALPRINTQ